MFYPFARVDKDGVRAFVISDRQIRVACDPNIVFSREKIKSLSKFPTVNLVYTKDKLNPKHNGSISFTCSPDVEVDVREAFMQLDEVYTLFWEGKESEKALKKDVERLGPLLPRELLVVPEPNVETVPAKVTHAMSDEDIDGEEVGVTSPAKPKANDEVILRGGRFSDPVFRSRLQQVLNWDIPKDDDYKHRIAAVYTHGCNAIGSTHPQAWLRMKWVFEELLGAPVEAASGSIPTECKSETSGIPGKPSPVNYDVKAAFLHGNASSSWH